MVKPNFGKIGKVLRQALLRQAVTTKRFENQHQLAGYLLENGCKVTQATIARDLHELRIMRFPDDTGPRYILSEQYHRDKPLELVRGDIVSVDKNETVVIIRTLPARALGVAEFLNACGNDDIFGAIGQSSVVVVYPKEKNRLDAIIQFLHQ